LSFSRLLLVGANSKKCIKGIRNDKVCVSSKIFIAGRDAYEGEVVLCFQLDEISDPGKRVAHCLGMPAQIKRCDGLVFYSQDDNTDRVICLVEMKNTNITDAAKQIKSTKKHIEDLLRKECDSLPDEYRSECSKQIARIIWKASLYHSSSSPGKVEDFQRELKADGFIDIGNLTSADNDLRPLLSGEGRSAKEMAKKIRKSRNR